jgi:hypothetical protein
MRETHKNKPPAKIDKIEEQSEIEEISIDLSHEE